MAIGWLSFLAGVVFAAGPVEILVLYDNTTAHDGAAADWGFSALVKSGGAAVLFDAGAKPDLLFRNMQALGVRPASITHTVISHAHADHLGGVYRVMSEQPSIAAYFLEAFPPQAFRTGVRRVGAKPVRIVPGVWSTGQVDGQPPEQALIIETATGLIVVTGCSHPGVVAMVEAAKAACGDKPVRLLLGGFHMLNQDGGEIARTMERLRVLGVQTVAPTHCTGEAASQAFSRVYGKNAVAAGAGKRFTLD